MLKKINIKIFADGASVQDLKVLKKNKLIKGFTTNPSLMRKAGVKNYLKFAKEAAKVVAPKPLSLEVFSDEIFEMERQALKLAKIGKNVNIKIPITNTKGHSTKHIISSLCNLGYHVNVTAIFTLKQITDLLKILNKNSKIILSIFAGRIADSGVDPEPLCKKTRKLTKKFRNCEILWASTREVFNVMQAQRSGCHIITVPNKIIMKFENIGKDQNKFSLETIKMFYKDAAQSKYRI